MRDTAELLGGDEFYEGIDIMAEISNIMTQLDASLYTPLFIPADEGISLGQRRYQNEAFAYYDDAVNYLESFLRIVPEGPLENARRAAAAAKYEIRIEQQ